MKVAWPPDHQNESWSVLPLAKWNSSINKEEELHQPTISLAFILELAFYFHLLGDLCMFLDCGIYDHVNWEV
jgi:hypothetical protein